MVSAFSRRAESGFFDKIESNMKATLMKLKIDDCFATVFEDEFGDSYTVRYKTPELRISGEYYCEQVYGHRRLARLNVRSKF